MKRAAIKDGLPVVDVSSRRMKTLRLIVDEVMEIMPHAGSLETLSPAQRSELRYWLELIANTVAFEMEWNYRRAIDSALSQADGLARDPERYSRQKRRSAKERAAAREHRRQQSEEHARLQLEREASLRDLVDKGALRLMPNVELRDSRKPDDASLQPDRSTRQEPEDAQDPEDRHE